MKVKTGLGDNPLKWIKDTSKEFVRKEDAQYKVGSAKIQKSQTLRVPKFKTFKAHLWVLIRKDQLEFLEGFAREIMMNREPGNKRERITKNTVLRTYIDILKDVQINKKNIPDETELIKRIKEKVEFK